MNATSKIEKNLQETFSKKLLKEKLSTIRVHQNRRDLQRKGMEVVHHIVLEEMKSNKVLKATLPWQDFIK